MQSNQMLVAEGDPGGPNYDYVLKLDILRKVGKIPGCFLMMASGGLVGEVLPKTPVNLNDKLASAVGFDEVGRAP